MPDFKPGKLLDFFKYFSETPQKNEAVERLEAALREKAPELLRDEAYWVAAWRTKPSVPAPLPTNPLDVQHLSQVDSAFPDQDLRTCFTSCCTMVANHLKPDLFKNTQGLAKDDYYFKHLLGQGSSTTGATRTTDPQSQQACLRSLGIKATFRTNGSWSDVKDLLAQGIPVAAGVLHKGHWSAPYGGGHYVLIVGYDDKFVYCNDPAGTMDCSGNGGYGAGWSTQGKNRKYVKEHFLKRWMPDGYGWFMDVAK